MANARQVARWIVDDVVADIQDVIGLSRMWKKKLTDAERTEIVEKWLDIAEAYVKKYSGDDMQALDHINGDPYDNRPENLRVVTVSENIPALTEGIGVLYRVHVYLYRQWREAGFSDGPIYRAIMLVVEMRDGLLDKRDQIDEGMEGIA